MGVRKMNKGGDIAVTLLVVMAIVTAGAASFIFLTSSSKLLGKVYDSRQLDNVYAEEEKLDFYISEVMNAAVSKTLNEVIQEKGAEIDRESEEFKESFKEKFVSNFLEELNKYKNEDGSFEDPELLQFEQQMKIENVQVENGKVISSFDILIKIEEDEILSVYTYIKTFEKEIEQGAQEKV